VAQPTTIAVIVRGKTHNQGTWSAKTMRDIPVGYPPKTPSCSLEGHFSVTTTDLRFPVTDCLDGDCLSLTEHVGDVPAGLSQVVDDRLRIVCFETHDRDGIIGGGQAS